MDSTTRSLIERDGRDSFCMGLKERYARKKSDNRKIFAENAVKAIGPFYCPECYSDAIVRKDKGSGRIDHFAHIAVRTKLFSGGETELHQQCKNEICDSLKLQFPDGNWKVERAIEANIDKNFTRMIPDISGRIFLPQADGTIKHVPVVIEVQRSFLQIPIIYKRTVSYSSRNPNVYILWVVPLREELKPEAFRPRLFERYLHCMYYGRIYYWWKGMGCDVMPVHFGKTKRHIGVSTWIEAGEEKSVGGYDKDYKTIKLPVFAEPVNIGKDFMYTSEKDFDPYKNRKSNHHYKIPKRNIYWDNTEPWWDKVSEYVKEGDKLMVKAMLEKYYIDDYSDEEENKDDLPNIEDDFDCI